MTCRPSASPTRLRVYALLSEGKVQSYVAGQLKMSTGTIGHHAKILEDEGYLQRVEGTKNPVIYEKGPKGPDLDKLIIASNIRINATGVTQCSKRSGKIPKANVHHLKFRLNVIEHGDLEHIKGPDSTMRPFLKQYQDYRNVKRWKGKLAFGEELISVEYEETPNKRSFYVYPPELNLSIEELDNYEQLAAAVCCEISAYVQKAAGWKFGFPELTDWERHIAVDTPEFMKQLAGKYFMRSEDGKAWTSASQGKSELEFSDIDQVKIMLELPGEVITMKSTLGELVENMQLISKALKEMEQAFTSVANINGQLVRQEARETIEKVKVQGEQAMDEVQAAVQKIYDGVMYQ